MKAICDFCGKLEFVSQAATWSGDCSVRTGDKKICLLCLPKWCVENGSLMVKDQRDIPKEKNELDWLLSDI